MRSGIMGLKSSLYLQQLHQNSAAITWDDRGRGMEIAKHKENASKVYAICNIALCKLNESLIIINKNNNKPNTDLLKKIIKDKYLVSQKYATCLIGKCCMISTDFKNVTEQRRFGHKFPKLRISSLFKNSFN